MPTIAAIDGNGTLRTVNTLPNLGQANSANSSPVVLASDQSTILVSGVGPQQNSIVGPFGRSAAAASVPIVLSNEDNTNLAAISANTAGFLTPSGSRVYDVSNATHIPAYYQVNVTTSGTPLATLIGTAIPTWATLVFITPETGPVRYRCDGTNPTASVGQPIAQSQSWPIQSAPALSGAVIISQTTGSITTSIEFRG